MIAAVAVCPHPPLLFRELAGQRDVAADLRAACRSAITSVTGADPDLVVVVGGAEGTRAWDPSLSPEVHRFGAPGAPGATGAAGAADRPGLPLSLGVASRLLQECGWGGEVEQHAIAFDASAATVAGLATQLAGRPERIVLVVMGDGSARRGDTAPGYVDERAFPFDEATAGALSRGDLAALMGMDAVLAEELMVGCRAAFAVMATALHQEDATPTAMVTFQDDPWGVMYFVATWQLA